MIDRAFVDTNVFVYADDAAAGDKRARAREVLAPLIRERRAVVSTQIMQEYFVVATRKLQLTPERGRRRVEQLARLDVVIIRPPLVLDAIDLHRLHSISLWDALVVACASAGGCHRLLSEDLRHGQVIAGVAIENPFLPASRAGERQDRYRTARSRPGRGRGRSRR